MGQKLVDTRKDYLPFGKPNFSEEEVSAVARVLRSGWVGMGPETLAFEHELAEYLGVPHVVTVNSCTSALFLSLLVSGVGPGDEVMCPSLTWCSTANSALYLGARPVFTDVDPDTLCVTPELVRAKLTARTKAVLVVHFGGLAVDVTAIRNVLPEGIAIIEDAAHAFGARFSDGTRVGASGDLTCFSFYANKNLSTGEGGAIALSDQETAGHLRSLRQHGLPLNAWQRFMNAQTLLLSNPLTELGYKMNYTDLQASIGRVQLSRQKEFDVRRLEIARCYLKGLEDFAPALHFQTHCVHPHHARHLFVIQLPAKGLPCDRNEVLLRLREKNVGATIHYSPLHLMPLYGKGGSCGLEVTERVVKSLITLPLSSSMTVEDAEYVVTHLKGVLAFS